MVRLREAPRCRHGVAFIRPSLRLPVSAISVERSHGIGQSSGRLRGHLRLVSTSRVGNFPATTRIGEALSVGPLTIVAARSRAPRRVSAMRPRPAAHVWAASGSMGRLRTVLDHKSGSWTGLGPVTNCLVGELLVAGFHPEGDTFNCSAVDMTQTRSMSCVNSAFANCSF
jgi:hypothetical protein